MNIPRYLVTISEPIAQDEYGRPVLSFKRKVTGKEIIVTKVVMNDIPHYISSSVEIPVYRGDSVFSAFNSLPRFFSLVRDDYSDLGVIVIQDLMQGFYVEPCVLIERIGEWKKVQ